jgi:O-6-methylguanine DNA methyltransferase
MNTPRVESEIERHPITTPLGVMILCVLKEEKIIYLNWQPHSIPKKSAPKCKLAQETSRQIHAYFHQKLEKFDLPIEPSGTDFQKQIWALINKISYGKTKSYQEISNELRRCNSARPVGNAIGKNPICLITPCHRIIKASGELGNYSGGAEIKKHLLYLESKIK